MNKGLLFRRHWRWGLSALPLALVAALALIFTWGHASSGGAGAVGGAWAEVGDAGNLPGTAQVPVGLVKSISGTISSSSDVDMYQLCLPGGGTFSASTVPPGAATFDTQLFLFNLGGFGVYANDDTAPSTLSRLPAGHPLTPAAPGTYYLAISGYDLDPGSPGGLIFPTAPFTGIFGPTGPGGGLPISGWGGVGGTGTYTIALTGVAFCVPTQINITKVDNATGALLPGSCYRVGDAANNPLFEFCDNETDYDEDPVVGTMRVTVAPGVYSVEEIFAPPGYKIDPTKQMCDATVGKCELTFRDIQFRPPMVDITCQNALGLIKKQTKCDYSPLGFTPVGIQGIANFGQDLDKNGVAGYHGADITVRWPPGLDPQKGSNIICPPGGTPLKLDVIDFWGASCTGPQPTKLSGPILFNVGLNCTKPGRHTVSVSVVFTREAPLKDLTAPVTDSVEINCYQKPGDTDSDGCLDTAEGQTAPGSENTGGRRDPNNFWDFYDTPDATGVKDKVIDIVDIVGAVAHFGATRMPAPTKQEALAEAVGPAPPGLYWTAFDRTLKGPNAWNTGPPDGAIDIFEITAAVAQFGHFCV